MLLNNNSKYHKFELVFLQSFTTHIWAKCLEAQASHIVRDAQKFARHDGTSLAHPLLEPLHHLLVRRHPRPARTMTIFLIVGCRWETERFASGIANNICV